MAEERTFIVSVTGDLTEEDIAVALADIFPAAEVAVEDA